MSTALQMRGGEGERRRKEGREKRGGKGREKGGEGEFVQRKR